jgi:tetratricopeptide (TPR) repeat protein
MHIVSRWLLITGMLLSRTYVSAQSSAPGNRSGPNSRSGATARGDLHELLDTAADLLEKGQVDQAQALLKKVLAVYPESADAYYQLAWSYYKQYKYKSASESLGKVLRLKSDAAVGVYIWKARLDLSRWALQEALATCENALRVDPWSTEAYRTMAEAQTDLNQYSQAAQSLKTAIKLDPNQPDAYVALGYARSKDGDRPGHDEEAFAAYSKAMELDPKHQIGRFELGRFLVERGKLAEARKLWEHRTSDKDNEFPNFIVLLQRAENLQGAQRAIAERPNDPDSLVQYGLAIMDGDSWVVDGRQERAAPFFKNAIALDPKSARAHYALGRCYVEMQDMSKAKVAFLKREASKEAAILDGLDSELAAKLRKFIKDGPLREIPRIGASVDR